MDEPEHPLLIWGGLVKVLIEDCKANDDEIRKQIGNLLFDLNDTKTVKEIRCICRRRTVNKEVLDRLNSPLLDCIGRLRYRDRKEYHILAKACEEGRVDALKFMVDRGAVPKPYMLRNAAQCGHDHVITFLLRQFPDLIPDDAVAMATLNGHVNAVRVLLQSGAKPCHTALCYACEDGNIEIMTLLIDHGAPIGDVPLVKTAEQGRLEASVLLLERGANARAYDDLAFRCACRRGHLKIAKILLDRGCEVHSSNNEALRSAAYNGHEDVVRFLIERGAQVNTGGVLSSAIRRGHIAVVKLLIDHGATDDRLRWSVAYFLHDELDESEHPTTWDLELDELMAYMENHGKSEAVATAKEILSLIN